MPLFYTDAWVQSVGRLSDLGLDVVAVAYFSSLSVVVGCLPHELLRDVGNGLAKGKIIPGNKIIPGKMRKGHGRRHAHSSHRQHKH